jgi:hypothetical protein
MIKRQLHARIVLCAVLLALLPLQAWAEDVSMQLAPPLDALIKVASGKMPFYTLSAEGSIKGLAEKASLKIGRKDENTFFVSVDIGRDVKCSLVVSPEKMFIDVPNKNVVFVAEGKLPDGAEVLQPQMILNEAMKMNSVVGSMWPTVVQQGDSKGLLGALSLVATVSPAAKPDFADSKADYLSILPTGGSVPIKVCVKKETWKAYTKVRELSAIWGKNGDDDNSTSHIDISLRDDCYLPGFPSERKVVPVPRAEMERALQRGAMRAIQIKIDDANAVAAADKTASVPGALLEIKDGQRTCWLTGTPHDMGVQHGTLMKSEIRRVTDSTLYVVGFVYSIAKGSWFLNDIRDAWKRLEPHCDPDYMEELKGLAEGSGIAYEEMKIANIFPELFHCSGFAISGDATVGGKLYHGRVLDYMTEIGLQNVQVDFITKKNGCNGTLNVGYAGFIGCVSGMNDKQISLGEMGGRGEGNWDGTPMAFLMRRVLEKADTLEQAQKIFSDAKRTCEYYYVIADGKSRSAVGVAAFPDKIQFIKQGEVHEQLPNAFPGCVLLSAGDRYKLLCERTKGTFGKIDEQGALDLMKRPVAMGSNLHNVLFIPEDQNYWVAHASLRGHQPAATQPYVKHSLAENLKKLEQVAKPQP